MVTWPPRLATALIALLALAGTVVNAAAQDKLDNALRAGKKAGKVQQVIVTAKPGYEAWARQLLAQRGKTINAELPSVGGFAVQLSADELELCKASVFVGCSEDSHVSPSGAPPKPSPDQSNKPVASSGPAAVYSAPAVNSLLGTLGLTPSAGFGAGVTVAVID